MIKSLFEDDETIKKEEKKVASEQNGERENASANPLSRDEKIRTQNDVRTQNTEIHTPDDEIETFDEIKTAIETGIVPPKTSTLAASNKPLQNQPFEINKPIGQPHFERKNEAVADNIEVNKQDITQSARTVELEKKLREIEDELKRERKFEVQTPITQNTGKAVEIRKVEPLDETETPVRPIRQEQIFNGETWNDVENNSVKTEMKVPMQTAATDDFMPESTSASVRKMGMAWSAAIALFGSVVFLLILGWGADLLLGTSPWGIIVGIIVGSIIGFIQFFRTTSQIFKGKPNDFEKVSIASNLTIAENNAEKIKIEPEINTFSNEQNESLKMDEKPPTVFDEERSL